MERTGILLIEDRDLGFFIVNPTGIDEASQGQSVKVTVDDGADWEDEDETVWLDQQNGSYRVTGREAFFENPDFDSQGYPIPTPIIINDRRAWRAWQKENG